MEKNILIIKKHYDRIPYPHICKIELNLNGRDIWLGIFNHNDKNPMDLIEVFCKEFNIDKTEIQCVFKEAVVDIT